MRENNIQTIIDTHLAKWISLGINKLPKEIENDMADPAQDPSGHSNYPVVQWDHELPHRFQNSNIGRFNNNWAIEKQYLKQN